jgi:hypothetical protein
MAQEQGESRGGDFVEVAGAAIDVERLGLKAAAFADLELDREHGPGEAEAGKCRPEPDDQSIDPKPIEHGTHCAAAARAELVEA